MTIRWSKSPWAASSLLGHLQALVDRLGGVGAAARQALAQDRRVGRGDEDLDRVRLRRPHLLGALDLDLEHDRVPGLEPALDLRAQGPVVVAAVGGELEEVVLVDRAVELLGREEVVVAPVLLALARLPGRRRDRELEVGTARSSSSLIRVPLPTPEGPVMTKTLAAMRPRILTGAAVV